MEAKNILSANILDILFEGKNKEYGAYYLRNTYDRRINTALGITAIAIIIICSSAFIGNNTDDKVVTRPDIITELANPDIEKEKIIESKKIIKPKPFKTIIFVPPIIVKEKLVIEPQVENDKMADTKIDTKTIDGVVDDRLTPVEIKGSNVIEAPVKKENKEDGIATFVEIEAKFKGDWGAYLKKEIEKNLDELTEANESGTCIVRFVVSKDGSVSNVEALTMKNTKLAEVAVNAIRRGPKWIPAIQNGTQVNAYRQQPVTFKIND